jgi:hypothetical protein
MCFFKIDNNGAQHNIIHTHLVCEIIHKYITQLCFHLEGVVIEHHPHLDNHGPYLQVNAGSNNKTGKAGF